MQTMSGKTARVDKLRASVEWEQSMKEIENAILRVTGAVLDGDILTQLKASIEWIDSSDFSGRLSSADNTVLAALKTLEGIPRGRVLLDEATASASATISVTSSAVSSYDLLRLEFINIRPATNGTGLWLRVSDDLGVSWESGASDYAWKVIQDAIDSASHPDATTVDAADAQMYLVPDGANDVGNGASYAISGCLALFDVSDAALQMRAMGELSYQDSAGMPYTAVIHGRVTFDVDGIQISFAAGNITSGTIRLWGLSRS